MSYNDGYTSLQTYFLRRVFPMRGKFAWNNYFPPLWYTGCLFKKFATLITYKKLLEFLWKISHLECSNLANLASLNLWLPTLSKISSENHKLHWNLIKYISLTLFVPGSDELLKKSPYKKKIFFFLQNFFITFCYDNYFS